MATAEFSKFAGILSAALYSTGIPSPPLALLVVMLSKAHRLGVIFYFFKFKFMLMYGKTNKSLKCVPGTPGGASVAYIFKCELNVSEALCEALSLAFPWADLSGNSHVFLCCPGPVLMSPS